MTLNPNKTAWVPLKDVIDIIHHPDFYWGGFTPAKYLELRIDTRDNCCLVRDRNGNAISLADLSKGYQDPVIKGMNDNPRYTLTAVDDSQNTKAEICNILSEAGIEFTTVEEAKTYVKAYEDSRKRLDIALAGLD